MISKKHKAIAWVFVMSIHLSELGLLLIDSVFAFLSTFDFLSTVHGDYDKGEIENVLFVYEKIEYRIQSLLSKNNYWIPSHGC